MDLTMVTVKIASLENLTKNGTYIKERFIEWLQSAKFGVV